MKNRLRWVGAYSMLNFFISLYLSDFKLCFLVGKIPSNKKN